MLVAARGEQSTVHLDQPRATVLRQALLHDYRLLFEGDLQIDSFEMCRLSSSVHCDRPEATMYIAADRSASIHTVVPTAVVKPYAPLHRYLATPAFESEVRRSYPSSASNRPCHPIV